MGERKGEPAGMVAEGRKTDGTAVFSDAESLKPTYTPHELPHRDEQVDELASVLGSALRGETPSNVLMYGRCGTGKTATARYVGRELETAASASSVELEVVHVDCRTADTQNEVLGYLARRFGRGVDSYWPRDRVYDAFAGAVDARERTVVVVLDEVGKLVDNDGDTTLYCLSRTNGNLEDARVSVVGVSDDVGLTDRLDPRVRSSLGEENVFFPSYTDDELRDVLRSRVKTAFVEGAVTEEAVDTCAELSVHDGHGDARRALELLRSAGRVAEALGAETVRADDVRTARTEILPRRQNGE